MAYQTIIGLVMGAMLAGSPDAGTPKAQKLVTTVEGHECLDTKILKVNLDPLNFGSFGPRAGPSANSVFTTMNLLSYLSRSGYTLETETKTAEYRNAPLLTASPLKSSADPREYSITLTDKFGETILSGDIKFPDGMPSALNVNSTYDKLLRKVIPQSCATVRELVQLDQIVRAGSNAPPTVPIVKDPKGEGKCMDPEQKLKRDGVERGRLVVTERCFSYSYIDVPMSYNGVDLARDLNLKDEVEVVIQALVEEGYKVRRVEKSNNHCNPELVIYVDSGSGSGSRVKFNINDQNGYTVLYGILPASPSILSRQQLVLFVQGQVPPPCEKIESEEKTQTSEKK